MIGGDKDALNPFGGASEEPAAFEKLAAARPEERAAQRYPCSGRAKILTSGGRSIDGRMFDISMTGASVLMEERVSFDGRCTLTVSVYKGGTLHHFQVRARFVHASLAGQSGFKHGFEFDAPDSSASKALATLTQTRQSALG